MLLILYYKYYEGYIYFLSLTNSNENTHEVYNNKLLLIKKNNCKVNFNQ